MNAISMTNDSTPPLWRNNAYLNAAGGGLFVSGMAMDLNSFAEGLGQRNSGMALSAGSSAALSATGFGYAATGAPGVGLAIGAAQLGINYGVHRYERSWSNELKAGFAKVVSEALEAQMSANDTIENLQAEMVAKGCP